MLFVGGILGEFIRSIPATVIITLLLSFLFSIVFIPAVARVFLLNAEPSRNPVVRGREARRPGDGQAGRVPVAQRVEGAVRRRRARDGRRRGGDRHRRSIAGTLGFSIFPTGKDVDGLQIAAEFPPGTTIERGAGDLRRDR